MARGWILGLYIRIRPTSEKAGVVDDMAAFWREIPGSKGKMWVDGLWRPIPLLQTTWSNSRCSPPRAVLPRSRSFCCSEIVCGFAMEGSNEGNLECPTLDASQQSYKRMEKEADEDVRVLEEPVKQKQH